MKSKVAIVLLMISSLALAGVAEAAKPKKRTRNSNRVGAYGAAHIGYSRYYGDHSDNEQDLLDTLMLAGFPFQELSSNTEDTDIGYQATFGYRFNRYLATELSLAQFGDLVSTANGELDLGNGFVPTTVKLNFSVGGPVISAIGILPVNDHFEFYGRGGVFFASSDLEFSSRIDGESGGSGSIQGDSTELVLGIGATWHINQVYSIRAEYLRVGEVGQEDRTGTEELDSFSIGLTIRF